MSRDLAIAVAAGTLDEVGVTLVPGHGVDGEGLPVVEGGNGQAPILGPHIPPRGRRARNASAGKGEAQARGNAVSQAEV